MDMRVYTTHEAGKLIGYDPSTVQKWIDGGKLKAHKSPGGHRRIRHDDLVAFAEEHELMLNYEALKPADDGSVTLPPEERAKKEKRRKAAKKARKAKVAEEPAEGEGAAQ